MRADMRCAIMAAVLVWAVTPAAAEQKPIQPSFNCHEATTVVERVICSHDDLATLDLDTARLYREAVSRAPAAERKHLQTAHARWQARRNACTATATRTLQQCIEAEYRARIAELRPVE